MTNMRDKIVLAMNSHNTDVRVGAAMDDFEEVGGHTNHLHALHADVILAALPSMIAPLVWSNDVEYFSYATTQTGQYQVREAESGWYVQLDCYRSILVAEQLERREQGTAAANAHHRAAIMKAFTLGETT